MSAELLRHLADRYAFDSTPPFHDLGAYHVPFDDLTGRPTVERRLREAVIRGERAAIVASSGSGKSSVVAHVLGPSAVGVAPIVVPVRAVEPGGATSPSRVADELIAMLRRYAEEALALSAPERSRAEQATGQSRRVTTGHARGAGVALALGWLGPRLGREITRQTEHDELVTLREKTEVVDQLLRAVADDGLRPVLVFDDSDRWIGSTDKHLVAGFFGDVVRWAADLQAAMVVAVHDRYFQEVPRSEVLQFLDTPVDLPRLAAPSQLTAILDHRVELNVVDSEFADARSEDAFDRNAVEALFDVYEDGASVRRVIQLCHVALHEAVERLSASRVAAVDVEAAVNAG